MLRANSSIALILFILFYSNTIYGLSVLFLPKFIADKDIDEYWTGVVFAFYAVSHIGFSLLCGKIIDRVSHKKVIVIGALVMSEATVAFSVLVFLKSKRWIVVISVALRLLQGAASAYINTATYSYAARSVGDDDMATTVALIETVVSLGNSFGPLLGSIVYEISGESFAWTFVVFGVCLLPSVAAIPHVVVAPSEPVHQQRTATLSSSSSLRKNPHEVDESVIQADEDHGTDIGLPPRREFTYSDLLRIPRVLFAAMTVMIGFAVYSALEPTLLLRMGDYGLTRMHIMGMIFSSMPLSYVFGTLVAAVLVPKWVEIRVVLVTGSFLLGVSLLLIGPVFGEKSLMSMIMGLVLCGFLVGFIAVPNMGEMMFVVKQHKFPVGRDLSQTNSLLSGILNCFMGIGMAVGPLMGSSLCKVFGFRGMCNVTAGATMLFTFLYFFFCQGCEAFTSTCSYVVLILLRSVLG